MRRATVVVAMHDIVHGWAVEYRVPPVAIAALLQRLGIGYTMPTPYNDSMSETAVSQRVRLAAAQAGILAWRNNKGAMQDENGNFVRFGLCNDTKEIGARFRSADLIGINMRLVTHEMVGTYIGQFWCREVKKPDWSWSGTEHEMGQMRWMELILSKGGDAAFTTGVI